MPKPPGKGKMKETSKRLPIRDVAAQLELLTTHLRDTANTLDDLYVALHTRGLDERGPITERDNDIPF